MKKSLGVFVLAFILTGLASPLYALDYSPDRAATAIQADYRAGLLDRDNATVLKARAYFDAASLPAKYLMEKSGADHFVCGTAVILELREAAPSLSAWARDEVERILPDIHSRPRAVAPHVWSSTSADKDLTDYAGAIILPNVYYTEHFALRWGNGFTFNDGEIADWAAIAEVIWNTEVVEMGYTPPWLSDEHYTDLYVGNSGDGAPTIDFQGAYTTLYNNNLGDPDNMSYMVFWPDIMHSSDSVRDIMSHEFYHVLQFQIALAGCYGHMVGDASNWAVEATATWAEDEVFDNINNYVYYVWGYMADPEITLLSSANLDAYDRVIFFKFISENWGGRQSLWTIWNECHNSLFSSIESLFISKGAAMDEQFVEFARKNLFIEYEEGGLYGGVNIKNRFTNYPVDIKYDSGALPESYGTNYLMFRPGNSTDERINVRFHGDQKVWSYDVAWNVVFAEVRSDGTYQIEKMAMDESGYKGEITIDGLGGEWGRIYLMVIPESPSRVSNAPGISYHIWATRGDDPFPPDTDGDDDTSDDTTDDTADDTAADDDSDDDSAQGNCDHLVGLMYDNCGFQLEGDAGAMSRDDALNLCEQGDGQWDCVQACSDSSGGCAEYKTCLADQCDITIHDEQSVTADDGGGDDDNSSACCGL